MRILLVSHRYPPLHTAGTEVYTADLAAGLVERGHEVTVFATEKDIAREHLSLGEREHEGVKVVELVNNLTGWGYTGRDLMLAGERIQNLRAAFNRREGIVPADFAPHPRMLGQGDGLLDAGPLKGVTVPLLELRNDYYEAMSWDPESGALDDGRARELGLSELLETGD